MIRVGAVEQAQLPVAREESYDARVEPSRPVVPRPRGTVDVGSTVRPPAA